MPWIERNFGSARGSIRLALSWLEIGSGGSGARAPDATKVRRLVFVCHGNICRSAFAEAVARHHGLEAASFGLSTSADASAHPPAAEAARARISPRCAKTARTVVDAGDGQFVHATDPHRIDEEHHLQPMTFKHVHLPADAERARLGFARDRRRVIFAGVRARW